jgi:hypothetical protein
VLFEMSDFHGWDMAALWDDIKFDVKHFSDSTASPWLVIRGGRGWLHSVDRSPRRRIRYFDHAQIEDARRWLKCRLINA